MWIFLRAIGLLAAAAMLAGNAPEEQEQICVSSARIWRGNSEDIRRIDAVPVPESFRRAFTAKYSRHCYNLVEGSLIAWHLEFGDEKSVVAALAFLEQEYLPRMRSRSEFPARLARAWRDASQDLRLAQPGLERGGDEYDKARRKLRTRQPVRDLISIIDEGRSFNFLAQEFLRAAIFHNSRPLLDKAKAYFVPARDWFLILRPADEELPEPLVNQLGLHGREAEEALDLEIRIALLTARLSKAASDIEATSALVGAQLSPELSAAAENAWAYGNFCDRGEEREYNIKRACEEGNFPEKIERLSAYQAELELLKAEHGPARGPTYFPRWQRAIELLRRRRLEDDSGQLLGQDRTADAMIELLLLRADLNARLAASVAVEGEDALERIRDYRREAMADLAAAERLAPPYVAPTRFRRIATRFLELYDLPGTDPSFPPSLTDRQAAYFRAMLADLDRVAVGDASSR